MTKPLQDLLERYRTATAGSRPDEAAAKIHVDEIASKVAVFYERIRSLIDYQEEHLLRKNFINRILRRRLLLKDLNINKNIAEPLIKEIIRAGRLPNDSIPETKIGDVQRIVDNFLALARELRGLRSSQQEELYNWLIRITANAIEENLFPPVKDQMLSEFMFWTIKEHLAIGGREIAPETVDLQLFIAVQRALLRVDEDQLNYRLLKFIYPDWNNPDAEGKAGIVKQLASIKEQIKKHIHSKLGKHFFKLCNRYNTVFYLIGDLLEKGLSPEELADIFENDKILEKEIRAAYNTRYDRQKSKLRRLALFSVISIFLSKIVVAMGIEYPIDSGILANVFNKTAQLAGMAFRLPVLNEFSLSSTLINIFIPAILMLIIVSSIRMPSDENFAIVMKEIRSVLNGDKSYTLMIPRQKPLFTRFMLRLLYTAIFFGAFYYLTLLLLSIKFSVANIAIFAFFTSLIAATGVKIHNRSKEINMEEKKPKFLMFLVDIFALPFIHVGKLGLATLSKLNILVVIFNLIIELPFQFFIEFVENFRSFIKSQKEELH